MHIREDTPEGHLIRFKGIRCILCGEVIEDNSTEMAHLVVNCCFLQDKGMSLMWYINHISEELTAKMTLPSGRTMENVEHCIYKLLLCAKHGDSGLDNADDSCLEEQTVGTVGRALCVLVSDFQAESLRYYDNILWNYHKNRLDSRS